MSARYAGLSITSITIRLFVRGGVPALG